MTLREVHRVVRVADTLWPWWADEGYARHAAFLSRHGVTPWDYGRYLALKMAAWVAGVVGVCAGVAWAV